VATVDDVSGIGYNGGVRQEPRMGSVSASIGQLDSRPCSSGACLTADLILDAGGYLYLQQG